MARSRQGGDRTAQGDRTDHKAGALIRLFVDGALGAGVTVALAQEQCFYLRTVMRRNAGDGVLLFNGRDGEWRARLTRLDKRAGEAEVEVCTREQTMPPDLWLLFAPVKRGPIDLIAEKATELGVAALKPVVTRRTIAGRVKTERLAAIAREAAEQSERLTVPTVDEPVGLDALLDDWDHDRVLIMADETGQGAPVADVLNTLPRHGRVAVIVGPEGGFAGDELDLLLRQPYVRPVSLGPRILRAETAALALIACCQAIAGDWDRVRLRR